MKVHPPVIPTVKPGLKLPSFKPRNEPLMTVNEATSFHNCHRVTLLRLIGRGQLRLVKSGSRWSFYRAEVSAVNNRNIAVYPHLTPVRKTNPPPD